MTVSSSIVRLVWTGDGTTVSFPITFKFYSASDITVTLAGAVTPTGYSITGGGTGIPPVPGTGTLVMQTAPASGVQLQAILNVPLTQLVNLVDGTAFQGAVLNQVNDRAVMAELRLQDQLSRSIRAPDGDANVTMLLPPAASRANLIVAFDANGNIAPSSVLPTGNSLSTATLAPFLNLVQTAAETAANVTAVNLAYPPGHVYRYGTNSVPGTTDMTAALNASLLQSYQSGGADPFWPAGQLGVVNLTITNSVRVKTEGLATTLVQLAGNIGLQIIDIQASKVFLDPLSFSGNIATDTGEFNHCITVGGGTSTGIFNVIISGAYGSNIRGDVVNIAGTATVPVYGVRVGTVDGLNIFRNTCSVTGGEGVEIDAIFGTAVGYRNFDCEPNSGSQQPIGVRIKYIRGANFQMSGVNLPAGVGSVVVDVADIDNNLLAASTPNYPLAPSSAGNIGIIVGNTQSLKIGTLRARNYQERLFNCSGANTINCSAAIEYVDILNCNNAELTFLTLFLIDAFVTLEIKSGAVTLAGITRYIVKGAVGSTVRLRNLAIAGGCVASTSNHGEYENLAINANTVTGNLFAAINSSLFKNVVVTNDSAATMMTLCSDNTFIGYSGAPAAFSTSGGTHVLLKSVLNGVSYRVNGLEASVAFNPGAILAAAVAQTTITVTGAAIGDYCTGVSFADVPTGYATVTWQGGVTAANTVTVTYRNTGGSTVTFGNNTLRALVQKAT